MNATDANPYNASGFDGLATDDVTKEPFSDVGKKDALGNVAVDSLEKVLLLLSDKVLASPSIFAGKVVNSNLASEVDKLAVEKDGAVSLLPRMNE